MRNNRINGILMKGKSDNGLDNSGKESDSIESICVMQLQYIWCLTLTLDWCWAYSLKVTSLSASPSFEVSSDGVYHQMTQIPQPESCPEFSEQSIDQLLGKHRVKQSSSELLSLRALSLIDKQNNNKREMKFSNNRSKNNSVKSTDSSVNSSISYKQSEFLSPVSGEEPYVEINANVRALESDDTSYAKAIRHNFHKHNANDFSSCDDDDTDRSRGLSIRVDYRFASSNHFIVL